MAHDNSGRIYVDTSATPKKGITIREVNSILLAGTLRLRRLCRSNRINTYAKYKPNGSPIPGNLTIVQRQAVNCGIDCSDTPTGCFSADLTALLARAKALFDWQKVTPTICRLLDFDGYEHRASCPYEPIADIIGNTTGDASMNLTILVHQNIESGNVQISDLVEALTRKGDAIGDFTRGLLVRDTSTPSAAATMAEATGSSQYVFPAPDDYAHPVTYDCVFVHYVRNGNTYWAVFYPRTYFQAKISLFYVSVENQTLTFPKTGGEASLIISGYNWQASWGGKDNPDADIVMSLSPGQGGLVSNWAEVTLSVNASNHHNYSGVVTKSITIVAPGQVGTGADFPKVFYVQQECALETGYIVRVDADHNELTGVIEMTTRMQAEKTILIQSDRSWELSPQNTSQGRGIVYQIIGDGEGTYYDGRNDISISPTAKTISPGTHTRVEVTLVNAEHTRPSGRQYQITLDSTDGQASLRLRIVEPQA